MQSLLKVTAEDVSSRSVAVSAAVNPKDGASGVLRNLYYVGSAATVRALRGLAVPQR